MLKEAKNVILFIGDGMGVTTVTSSRIHNAQKSNRNYWDGRLSFDEFPHVGLTMVRTKLKYWQLYALHAKT